MASTVVTSAAIVMVLQLRTCYTSTRVLVADPLLLDKNSEFSLKRFGGSWVGATGRTSQLDACSEGICDDQNRFIDVYLGFPSSTHDARILKESPFVEDVETKCAGGYLQGDPACPLLPYLMTPFKS
ncbi:hypothetical protein HPB47_003583 [Ixodes persulcatus]|uniref:Uncharacterized protein n=1 Tax=Ixodes persulcatus TaxID=34615 RepID=A0AC60PJ50_IXOPE|nr:hypothetical protein HPB47_003583 [Ixodes persulcatus]